MPGGDLVEGASRLNITQNGGDDLADEATAEARLRQEAQMQQKNSYAPPLNRGIRDVTADFVAATRKLPPGELVKDEYFTLFEAVGALEIMDAKMDSGYVPPGDSFEPDFDVCKDLKPTEVLWIMDELLRLEMSFHDGYPLSQNIFTSLHVFRLIHPANKAPYHFRFEGNPSESTIISQHLIHTVLRAYSIAVIKCVECALQTIQRQTYFEEEDFVTHLFGRELLPACSTQEARKLLVEAMDFVDGIPPRAPDEEEWKHLAFALKHRLVVREHILFSMSGRDSQWRPLRDKILSMNREHQETTPVPEAFSDKVTRQLATSTPPRPMPQLLWEQACSHWAQMCDDILYAEKLLYAPIAGQPETLMNFVWMFGYRKPSPRTYARAKMQELLTETGYVGSCMSHEDLVYRSIRDLTLAGDKLTSEDSFEVEVTTDPRHRAVRALEEFALAAAPEYINILRILCQNRCRMRRLMIQTVPIWRDLGTRAQEYDKVLQQCTHEFMPKSKVPKETVQPLYQWAEFHRWRIISWTLQLGFETDIYSHCEFRLISTVLADIMAHRQRIIDSATESLNQRRNENHKADEMPWATIRHTVQSRQIDFGRGLSWCLVGLYGLLECFSLIDTMPRQYENKQYQYEARMKTLLGDISELASGRQYYENVMQPWYHGVHFKKIVENTVEGVKEVYKADLNTLKQILPEHAEFPGTREEWQAEVKKLEKTCVAFNIALSKLGQACEKHGITELSEDKAQQDLRAHLEVIIPAPEKRYHEWWVVPEIKEK